VGAIAGRHMDSTTRYGRGPAGLGSCRQRRQPPAERGSAASQPEAVRDVRVVVGHLYADYLNIYADRGNIAVLTARAAWRGLELDVREIGPGEPTLAAEIDLYYVGGGQDREQALIAPDLAARGPELRDAVAGGAALLAVCGGYQLLGRFYRDRFGAELPGAGVLPLHTVAGERRMIGDVLLECELEPGERRTLAGFENHAGRTYLDEGAEPLGRVVAGFGNDGESGYEGCRAGRALGTYLHGPLLPRNPWLADWLLAQAVARRSGKPPVLDPLSDDLELQAHAVAAARARSRGGRY
jgi:CobQ-like glutamine amidotransferase family enzyme